MNRYKNRSIKLKKYEAVYKEYIRKKSKSPIDKVRYPRPENKHSTVEKSTGKKPIIKPVKTTSTKKLTDYQIFVKEQSKRDKYAILKPDERLAKIARSWKKRKLRRQPSESKSRLGPRSGAAQGPKRQPSERQQTTSLKTTKQDKNDHESRRRAR